MNIIEGLVEKLDALTSRPLKVERELDYRIALYQARMDSGEYTSNSDVKLSKNQKLYSFLSFKPFKEFDFMPGYGLKSRLIKAQVAEINLYERKTIVYAQHIWLGYQMYLSKALGYGFNACYNLPLFVNSEWVADPIEKDPRYPEWVKREESNVGCGSPAYFGGIWEDVD